jgi:hypothetical protein
MVASQHVLKRKIAFGPCNTHASARTQDAVATFNRMRLSRHGDIAHNSRAAALTSCSHDSGSDSLVITIDLSGIGSHGLVITVDLSGQNSADCIRTVLVVKLKLVSCLRCQAYAGESSFPCRSHTNICSLIWLLFSFFSSATCTSKAVLLSTAPQTLRI